MSLLRNYGVDEERKEIREDLTSILEMLYASVYRQELITLRLILINKVQDMHHAESSERIESIEMRLNYFEIIESRLQLLENARQEWNPIITRIPHFFKDSVETIQNSMVIIANQLRDVIDGARDVLHRIFKRKNPTSDTKRLLCLICQTRFSSMCPACGGKCCNGEPILNPDGTPNKNAAFDHFLNAHQSAVKFMWIVGKVCNQRMYNDPAYKRAVYSAFWIFQDRLKEYEDELSQRNPKLPFK